MDHHLFRKMMWPASCCSAKKWCGWQWIIVHWDQQGDKLWTSAIPRFDWQRCQNNVLRKKSWWVAKLQFQASWHETGTGIHKKMKQTAAANYCNTWRITLWGHLIHKAMIWTIQRSMLMEHKRTFSKMTRLKIHKGKLMTWIREQQDRFFQK